MMPDGGQLLILFTHSFPGGTGEPFLNDEIGILAENFDEVAIFTFETHQPARELPSNVKWIPLPGVEQLSRRKKLACILTNPFTLIRLMWAAIRENGWASFRKKQHFLFTLGIYLIRCASFIREKCPRHQYDRITAYSYWGDHKAVLPALLRNNKYADFAIARAHAFEIYDQSGIYHFFRGYSYNNLDHIVSVSEDGRQFLSRVFPRWKNKYALSRLGTTDQGENPFPQGDDTFHIVSCSSVQERKRILSIAKVIGRLSVKTEWTHFGSGPEYDLLKAIVAGYPSHIVANLPGHVSNETVLQHYREHPAHVFVNFSTMEGIPFSIMEALSFGIPIIACSAGGTKEIVNKDTGLLLDESAAEQDLQFALEHFRSSVCNTKAFRAQARKFWMNHFSADANFSKFCESLKKGIF